MIAVVIGLAGCSASYGVESSAGVTASVYVDPETGCNYWQRTGTPRYDSTVMGCFSN